ncbi:hypothetical protein AXF42_Ash014776 [Apostasia shenzhenica]|uniref:Uncharacterized protein n=1 Tax=Apostasia shenzhenica TaxID=1088818 RepID=A0A2H9ZW98_9ASPA|nr:hypothetical protein AXF42_Ash014776 [Apostasia shenzhenica]
MATAAAEVKAKTAAKADMVAVYVPLGMVVGALTMAAYTMEGQLAHSPSVRVNKQRRGTVPEVDEADRIAGEGDRYVNRSVFRRVAHVQDFDAVRSGVFDPTRPDNVFRQ